MFARLLPSTQNLSHVDAYNLTVQRQLSDSVSLEVAYVGNRGNGFFGDNPAANTNTPTIAGFGTLTTDQRRPFFNGNVQTVDGLSGAYGWTQGIDYFSQHRARAATTRSRPSSPSASRTATSCSPTTRYQKPQEQRRPDYFFIDPDLNYGPADFIRTHVFVLAGLAELPFGKGRKFMTDASGLNQALLGGWQVNANATIMSGLPFNIDYRDSGADRDTGATNRPNLIGDAAGRQRRRHHQPLLQRHAHRLVGQRLRPAGGRHLRQTSRATSSAGPGCWNVDASLFKRFSIGDRATSSSASRRRTCSTTST